MKTKQAEKQQPTNYPDYICQKCGHELDARGACPRCTAKPGDPCPQCGQKLSDGGATGGTYCKKCGQVFGATYPMPTPWGKKEDAHLAAVERWLAAEWRDDSEIAALLVDSESAWMALSKVCGYIPAESNRVREPARKLLQAELKTRRENDKGRKVQRRGDRVKTVEDVKRLRAARSNGKKAIHEPEDGAEAIRVAVAGVVKSRRGNRHLSMKAACLFQIKEHKLSIKWEALRKHVKKASKPSVTN